MATYSTHRYFHTSESYMYLSEIVFSIFQKWIFLLFGQSRLVDININ